MGHKEYFVLLFEVIHWTGQKYWHFFCCLFKRLICSASFPFYYQESCLSKQSAVLEPLNTWAAPSGEKLVLMFVMLLWGQGQAADQGLVWGNGEIPLRMREGCLGKSQSCECGREGTGRMGCRGCPQGWRAMGPTRVERNCPDILQRLRR